jgi:hypothetical protein
MDENSRDAVDADRLLSAGDNSMTVADDNSYCSIVVGRSNSSCYCDADQIDQWSIIDIAALLMMMCQMFDRQQMAMRRRNRRRCSSMLIVVVKTRKDADDVLDEIDSWGNPK